jgi:hypothetical protein
MNLGVEFFNFNFNCVSMKTRCARSTGATF